MIEFLKQLPHLEHYGTPIYFIYLILAFLPIFTIFPGQSIRTTNDAS